MRISIIVEGATEKALIPKLREFLSQRLAGKMPNLDLMPCDGRVDTGTKLRRKVELLLKESDAVIALTDVYTGTREFKDANDAKAKMRQWVGDEPRFYPHAAQYDFEAWLLPYWADIQKLAGHNKNAPGGKPEDVNHDKPPAYHLKEIFRIGNKRQAYVKPRDAGRILRDNDLFVAANACPELKLFLNTILMLSGGPTL